jgi:hypothetical protein
LSECADRKREPSGVLRAWLRAKRRLICVAEAGSVRIDIRLKGEEAMAQLLVHCAWSEDPERAAGLRRQQCGRIRRSGCRRPLTIEGSGSPRRDHRGIHEGFQPLRDVMQSFISNSGQIWHVAPARRRAASRRIT